jgi:acetolactate synthase-1/2/3 large subunit
MAKRALVDVTVGEAYLRLLAERGVDYVFANAGTDFAPLIEAWAKAVAENTPVPRPVTVPHENVAVHMALGHWMVSGRLQAVMVHVNVGTANTLCGLMNAARANVPLLLAAGRTPITETGAEGGRNIHIHWTQEMFDQAAMLREVVKWDYELRMPEQLETVVDRALSIANTEPTGPVYLTLPREVLARRMDRFVYEDPARHASALPQSADASGIAQLARLLENAQSPLIITSSLGFDRPAVEALSRLAQRHAIPVVQFVPRCLSLASDHPMHAGYDPHPWLQDADLVIVMDCAVPWIPARARPREGAKVVHVGADPLYQRIPIRGFECDLALASSASSALVALEAETKTIPAASRIEARRERMSGWRARTAERLKAEIERSKHRPSIDPAWLSHCVDRVLGDDTILLREAPQFSLEHLSCKRPGSFLSAGAAGGLGWGLGAAIGAKLASPESLVVAVVGDGSYMFGVPVAAHYCALDQSAPFLTVIVDNQRWNEVGAATRHLYPEGRAAGDPSREPLTYFNHALRLEKTVDVVGGYAERVTEPLALPEALARAVGVVRNERRQAVLNVVCS